MPRRLNENTYLSDINAMPLEELQLRRQQILKDIDNGRIGAARAAGNVVKSVLFGALAGIASFFIGRNAERGRKAENTKPTLVGLLAGAVGGMAVAVTNYVMLRKDDRLEADKLNNHLLTHIERTEFEKLKEAQYTQQQREQEGCRQEPAMQQNYFDPHVERSYYNDPRYRDDRGQQTFTDRYNQRQQAPGFNDIPYI